MAVGQNLGKWMVNDGKLMFIHQKYCLIGFDLSPYLKIVLLFHGVVQLQSLGVFRRRCCADEIQEVRQKSFPAGPKLSKSSHFLNVKEFSQPMS